ncbi:MAG: hypothetical protein NT075_34955 [Chloroflexi bacterium]|nr:hypothetical protein [Chloroflexota bacterium]
MRQFTFYSKLMIVSLISLLAFVFAACIRPPTPTEPTASANSVALVYQGPKEFGSDDPSKCSTLTLSSNQQALLGACDGTTQTQNLGKRFALDWGDIQTRFASFTYETPTETLTFTGTGTIEGADWQRAILAWARMTHAELATGKAVAAGRTVLSWNFGPLPDNQAQCKHLTVLNYGYAYAETVTCEGGEVLEPVGGWLTTEELTKLDLWSYQRAALYQDDNYIDGKGTQAMSETEITEATQWATDVYTRLLQTAVTTASSAPPAECPVATADTKVLVNPAQGYCLLYAATYTTVQTVPDTINVVLGSLMNHVDPRFSITVEDAAGRTLAQVADQVAANDAAPDTKVEPVSIQLDGTEAMMLDNLTGQDFNRRVVAIHNGQLYSFFFTPLGETDATRAKLETFYQGVIDSFRFVD